jgi:hypothetical protein
VDARSPEERTQQWVRDYEEERLEVVRQIARGELEGLVEQLMDEDEDKRYDMARHILMDDEDDDIRDWASPPLAGARRSMSRRARRGCGGPG